MNYDFMIWGHWQASSIALFFLLIMIYYAVNKYKFGGENLSNERLKLFFVLLSIYILYYVFIYDPRPKLVQNLLLTVVNSGSNISLNLNAGPLLGIILIIALAMGLFYGYRFVTKRVFKIGTVAK